MIANSTTITPAEIWSALVDSLDSMNEVELANYKAANGAASKAVHGLDVPAFSPEWFRAFAKAHARLSV